MRYLSLALVATLLCVAPAYSQKDKKAPPPPPVNIEGKTPEEALTLLIPGMSEKDPSARNGSEQKWQAICIAAGAPGKEAERLAICKLMAGKLDDVPEQARIWLLKQLEYIGQAECVAAVAKALDDPSELVRECAARSLANNPAEEAATALAAKLSSKDAKSKVALANALGYRRAASAVTALAAELTNETPAVAQAAARALGRIANADAATQLNKARAAAKEPVRLWICDAYLLCADKLMKDGKTSEASAIYNDLYDNEKIRSVRMAALEGVLRSAGDQAGDRITKLLTADDRDARDIALVEIAGISPKSLQALATSFDKLPAQAQILLLGALAARGEKAQAGLALKAAQSTNESLQRAGILALGRLGDATHVPILFETGFSKSPNGGIAKGSLAAIAGPGVDEKIIAILKAEKTPGARAGLIALLAERGAASAAPTIIEDALAEDAALRLASLQALAKLAEPKDVPAIVPAYLKSKGKDRDEAEKAIVAIVSRNPDAEKRADPVVAALTPDSRTALLPLLGRIGGAKAMAATKESLGSDSKEQKAAAVAALANWPDETVSADLLAIANGPDADLKKVAFLGVVRVNSISKEQPAPPRLVSLKKAMELANNDAEKKLVIDALATVRDIEALRFVLPYLDQKALVQPTCKTVIELAHSKTLREPNREEFHRALDRVMPICADKGLVERAKKYKQGG